MLSSEHNHIIHNLPLRTMPGTMSTTVEQPTQSQLTTASDLIDMDVEASLISVKNLPMDKKVKALQVVLNYKFNDDKHLLRALCNSKSTAMFHCAYPHREEDSNARLAMIGDKALTLHLVETQYLAKATKGKMSDKVAAVASNDNLKKIGEDNELGDYLSADPIANGGVAPKTMTGTVQAIIGAAFLDGGLDAAKTVIRSLGLV